MRNLTGTHTLADIKTMTRSELYQQIVPQLINYLRTQNLISEGEQNDVQENIDMERYEEACDRLSAIVAVEAYLGKMIEFVKNGLSDNDEIRNPLPAGHYTANDKDRLKAFCYKDAELAVMPVKVFTEVVSDDVKSTCGKIVDLICLSYIDNEAERNYLWECFRNEHEDDYFLLTSKADAAGNEWRLFSYAYFCFTNSSQFEMPDKLEFEVNKKFSETPIEYDKDNKYEQYFDVYDVMSESKYAQDVLSRYLRMYQILEYLGYRKLLADMTKGNIRENGFVRNVISKASKGSNNEFEDLKKGLKESFTIEDIIDRADIAVQQDFIKDRLMINNENHDASKLWKIVYKLRNCIVHNKESELHFTFANTSVYTDGIDLMNTLIEKLEPAIVNVINNHENNLFEFDEQRVKLY